MFLQRELIMGLDGISINQLRTPENNSAELNSKVRFASNQEHKTVDGLSQGQKIDPDQENEKNDTELLKQFAQSSEEDNTEEEIQEEVIKYDLSDSSKYTLKVDNEINRIYIVEKSSQKIVQQIDADELSHYVSFLSNSQGSIVNRKF